MNAETSFGGLSGFRVISSFVFLIVVALGMERLWADDFATVFEQANKFYEQGKFTEAVGAYEKIIQSGKTSAALYFNLGNALFKTGQLGRAIATYRLAEQLSPRDPDLRANLQFARNSVNGGATDSRARWRRWLGQLTLNEWTVLTVASAWLWLVLLTLQQWRTRLRRSLRGYTATAGVAAGLLGSCLAGSWYGQFASPTAIVVVPEAVVRFGPLDESQSAYTVRDGVELTVLGKKKEWLQVSDSRQRIGWLRLKQVVLVPQPESGKDS